MLLNTYCSGYYLLLCVVVNFPSNCCGEIAFFVLPFASSHIACQILSHNLLLMNGAILPALVVQGADKVKFTRRERLLV
jgi:hypothetical protein